MKYKIKSSFALRISGVAISILLALLLVQGVIWANAGQKGPSSHPKKISAGQFSESVNAEVITIGVGSSLTPAFLESIGYTQQNAAQLAVDQINDSGGIEIQGVFHPVTLVSSDDQCSGTGGEGAAHDLIGKGAVAVVGYTCSSASNAAQPIHRDAQVPMVSPSSTMVDLTEQGYTTTFRVISRDDGSAIFLAAYVRNWSVADTAAIIVMSGNEFLTDPISNTFTALGGAIVADYAVTSSDQFTTTLNAIHGHNPQVIFYADYDPINAAALRQTANRLSMTDFILAWVTRSDSKTNLDNYFNEVGSEAQGTLAAMDYRLAEDMPGYEAFNAAYIAKGFPNYGSEGEWFGAFAYDATMLILDAIRRAQSTDPRNIRDALAQMADYEGVVGTYQGFDPKGDVIPQWAWLAKFTASGWVKLHPTKLYLPCVSKAISR